MENKHNGVTPGSSTQLSAVRTYDSHTLTPPSPPGQWLNSDTRGLLWRLLLKVIPRGMPPSLWREHMSCKRQEYQDLRAEHRVDIAKVKRQQAGALVCFTFIPVGFFSVVIFCFGCPRHGSRGFSFVLQADILRRDT